MRRRVRSGVAVTVLSASLGVGGVACFDLFHSTSGIVSACELDAQACDDASAPPDAASDGGTDFSTFSVVQAVANAQHACAWLGACESPLGSNAFGTCMFDALLAYDVSANPNHPVRGEAHALWDCLWQVGSCDDVARCVFPPGSATCDTTVDVTTCGVVNRNVVIECTNGRPVGDNCGLSAQTCAITDAGPACGGGSVGPAGCMTECVGTHLHQCANGVDVGIDCASNGVGQCQGFPDDSHPMWLACVASGDAGCMVSQAVQCMNGYATSCLSGVSEQLYCTELLQAAGTTGTTCTPSNPLPTFDWTSPCAVTPPTCTADSCTSAGGVLGCARGASYTVDCSSQGLGPCRMVATAAGAAMNAACTKP